MYSTGLHVLRRELAQSHVTRRFQSSGLLAAASLSNRQPCRQPANGLPLLLNDSTQRARLAFDKNSKRRFDRHFSTGFLRLDFRRPSQTRSRYAFDPEAAARAKPLVTLEKLKTNTSLRVSLLVVVLGGGLFYVSNLETVPISGRRRFNCYSEATARQRGAESYAIMMKIYGDRVLPDTSPKAREVQQIMDKLIPVSGIEDTQWKVHVVATDEVNACVLPGGYVFVFNGLFKTLKDEDSLAAVLAHEIAHNVARHPAEGMSSMVLLAIPRFIFLGLDYSGFTFGLGQLFGELALNLGVRMRSSRVQEAEADHIGLMMMAKACYNPNAALELWKRMEQDEKASGDSVPEWLSTHPAHANRHKKLYELLDQANSEYQAAGCAGSLAYAAGFKDTLESFGFNYPGS